MPDGSLSDEQRQRYLAMMLEQAQRMQAIVEDLLTLSTLESSTSIEGEPVRLGAIIHTAWQQGRVLSNDQHVFMETVDEELCVNDIETERASAESNQIGRAQV